MPTRPRERALEHVEDFLYDLQDQPNGLARESLLAENYPHLTGSFINRHMGALIRMTPEQLVAAIGYPDPTGEQATTNVMTGATR